MPVIRYPNVEFVFPTLTENGFLQNCYMTCYYPSHLSMPNEFQYLSGHAAILFARANN